MQQSGETWLNTLKLILVLPLGFRHDLGLVRSWESCFTSQQGDNITIAVAVNNNYYHHGNSSFHNKYCLEEARLKTPACSVLYRPNKRFFLFQRMCNLSMKGKTSLVLIKNYTQVIKMFGFCCLFHPFLNFSASEWKGVFEWCTSQCSLWEKMALNLLKNESSNFICILGITYLDHAGSALFPESLLKAFTDDLRNNVYGKCKATFPLVFSVFHLNRTKLSFLEETLCRFFNTAIE